MAGTKAKNKVQQKPERTVKRGDHPATDNASDVPGRGGSRQGNIGHESNQTSDNAHR